MTGPSHTTRGDDNPSTREKNDEDYKNPGARGPLNSTVKIALSPPRTGFRRILLVACFSSISLIGIASAQSQVGAALCGTPIANFINSVVPLVVSLAMIVGAIIAAFMHARSGVASDAEQARFYLEWRNRASYTAITAPLLAFLIQMMIGFTGTGISSCIDLVPFF